MLALLAFRDEPGLRRAALRLAAMGALDAAALGLVAPGLPPAGWMLAHLPALLALATLGRAFPGRSWGGRLALAAGLLAAAALGQAGWMGAPPDAGSLLELLELAARGGAAGLALVLGLLPAHLTLRPPRLWWAARSLPAALATAGAWTELGSVQRSPSRGGLGTLSGSPWPMELRALVVRSLDLWARVEEGVPARDVRAALAGALERMLTGAARWRDLPGPGALPARTALDSAREALARRRDQTTDPVARARFDEAWRTLGAQSRHLDQIGQSRERLLAQVHRQVAAMETLHLAAVTQRSADAACGAEALRPLLEDLARLGDELDARGEARAALEEEPRPGVT